MKKILLCLIGIIAITIISIALTGMYKFNYLAGQQGYDVDGNKITVSEPMIYRSASGETIETYLKGDEIVVHFMQYDDVYLKAFTAYRNQSASGARFVTKDKRFTFWSKGNETSIFNANDDVIFTGFSVDEETETAQPRETIYFDPRDKEWKDDHGICATCLPDNGFSEDGQIEGNSNPVIWHELFFTLKNDLGENPLISEVKEILASQYSADPAWYGTHVSRAGDIFRVIVATNHEDTDFLSQRGALRATYDAIEVKP